MHNPKLPNIQTGLLPTVYMMIEEVIIILSQQSSLNASPPSVESKLLEDTIEICLGSSICSMTF